MTTVDQFLKALAVVESSDDPEAWGDYAEVYVDRDIGDGKTAKQILSRLPRAAGRWQWHPDRAWYEATRLHLPPRLGETWDGWQTRIVMRIFQGSYPQVPIDEIAMYWHMGHWVHAGDSTWDAKYAARFEAALLNAQEEE